VGKPLAFLRAPDEPARRHFLQAAWKRKRGPFNTDWLPDDLNCRERRRDSFHRELTDWLEGVTFSSTCEVRDDLVGEDLATLGAVAKPSRLDDRDAEIIALGGGRVANAQADLDQELVVALSVSPLEALLDRHGARDGLRRALEGDHETIAYVLHLRPAGVLDCTADEREVLASELLGGARADPGSKPRGAHEVSE
jgi:hypothetical protein